jgi:hypothetical protein
MNNVKKFDKKMIELMMDQEYIKEQNVRIAKISNKKKHKPFFDSNKSGSYLNEDLFLQSPKQTEGLLPGRDNISPSS